MSFKLFLSLLLVLSSLLSSSLQADSFLSEVLKIEKHNELIRKLNSSKRHMKLKNKILKSSNRSTANLNKIKTSLVQEHIAKKEAMINNLEQSLKRSKSLNAVLEKNYRKKIGRVETKIETFSTAMAVGAGALFLLAFIVVGRYRSYATKEGEKYIAKKIAMKKVFKDQNPLFRALRITSKINSNVNYVVYDELGDIKFASKGVESLFGGDFSLKANWPALELANFQVKKVSGKNVRVTSNNPQSYYIVSKKELAKSRLRICQLVEVPFFEEASISESNTSHIGVFNMMEDIFADSSSFKGGNLLDRVAITEIGKVFTSQDEEPLRKTISALYKAIESLDERKKTNYEIVLSKRAERINIEVYCANRLLSSDLQSGDLKIIDETLGRAEALKSMTGSFLVKNIRDGAQTKSKITVSFDEKRVDRVEESTFKMEFNELV